MILFNSWTTNAHDVCKAVGCASGVGLPPVTLSPSFLDKRVGTGPTLAWVGPTCAQTKPGLPGTCSRQAKLFQANRGRQT